jgi:hypothetical protein
MRDPAKVRTQAPHGAELEKRIDDAIDSAAFFGVWPAKAQVIGETPDVILSVLDRYRAAGWQVSKRVDRRDGGYVQVEQP